MIHPLKVLLPQDMTLKHLEFISFYFEANILISAGKAYLQTEELEQ